MEEGSENWNVNHMSLYCVLAGKWMDRWTTSLGR